MTKIIYKVSAATHVLTLFYKKQVYWNSCMECRCFSQEKLRFTDFRRPFSEQIQQRKHAGAQGSARKRSGYRRHRRASYTSPQARAGLRWGCRFQTRSEHPHTHLSRYGVLPHSHRALETSAALERRFRASGDGGV